jgi:hypothetical protein
MDFRAMLTIGGRDESLPATQSARNNIQAVRSCVEDVKVSMNALTALGKTFLVTWVFDKVWEGFKAGVAAVDEFAQSVVKTAAIITSLQGGYSGPRFQDNSLRW